MAQDQSVALYVIHCLDDDNSGLVEEGPRGGSKKRMDYYAEHKAYQGATASPSSSNYIKKIAAGPLLSDDNKFMLGSCFIVEATREAAEAFIGNDPFAKAGVWKQVSIHRYVSIPNGILAHD